MWRGLRSLPGNTWSCLWQLCVVQRKLVPQMATPSIHTAMVLLQLCSATKLIMNACAQTHTHAHEHTDTRICTRAQRHTHMHSTHTHTHTHTHTSPKDFHRDSRDCISCTILSENVLCAKQNPDPDPDTRLNRYHGRVDRGTDGSGRWTRSASGEREGERSVTPGQTSWHRGLGLPRALDWSYRRCHRELRYRSGWRAMKLPLKTAAI